MAELRVKGTGTIKLFESDNTSSVTIASPASLSANKTITLPDANVTLASGTMLATDGSGASLTALNASELGSGTVPTARLGSGSASSSVFLSGASTWIAAAGGKVVQVVQFTEATTYDTTSTSNFQGPETGTLTMVNTANDVLVIACFSGNPRNSSGAGVDGSFGLYRGDIASGTEIFASEDMVHDDVAANVWTPITLICLDTPGADTTYSISIKQEAAGTNTRLVGGSTTTRIIMVEIE
jgi:hypothetical protein